MAVYVAEIKGRGIAAFDANSAGLAERFVRDRIFGDDLMALMSGGLPLWDGVAHVVVRPAHANEEIKWRESRTRAIRRGDLESSDHGWTKYLVALTDPDRGKRVLRGRRVLPR